MARLTTVSVPPANLGPTSTTANPGKTSQIYSLPLDVSWTPDLFGRIRKQVRNAQYTAQVSAADLENERLFEQADLAEFFFEIRGQDALIQIYTQTVAADQKALDYNQAQYDTGVGDQHLGSRSTCHAASGPVRIDQSGYLTSAV